MQEEEEAFEGIIIVSARAVGDIDYIVAVDGPAADHASSIHFLLLLITLLLHFN